MERWIVKDDNVIFYMGYIVWKVSKYGDLDIWDVFIVNFEQISPLFLVFLLLSLSK